MKDSPLSRERRQILDKIGSFFSNLFSPDDYVEEVRKVDIALSEYGEWPWQVSLRVREAPGNDGQAVLGDRQVIFLSFLSQLQSCLLGPDESSNLSL